MKDDDRLKLRDDEKLETRRVRFRTLGCYPLTGAVDGLFYRACFWFGSSPESVRMRHLRDRPSVSATHTRGETLAVTVHGRAEIVDLEDPRRAGFRAYCVETYGDEWGEWAEPAAYARIEPARMFAFSFDTS